MAALVAVWLAGPAAFGQSAPDLSEHARRELTAVQDLMQRNEYQAALDTLNKLRPEVRNRKYDLAVTYQTLGYVYSNLNRQQESTRAFIDALETNALPRDITHEIQYTVAQLLIADGEYEDGMKYLAAWFRNERNPPAQAHYMAATAYYFMDQYKQMVYQAKNAIRKRPDAPASWYELLLAGYYETDDMNSAVELMETMLNKFPANTEYWTQLAGLYLSAGKNEKALALMELAYLKGFVKKHDELMQLVQTYLYLEMPYKAASLLTTEMDKKNINRTRETVKLLADSWFLAREIDNGISVLTEAITQFDDPELYYRLGQLYVEKEDWNNAVRNLNRATLKSDFRDIADAWLLLGVAALRGDDRATSYRALNNALRYDSTKDQARQWMAELRE